MYIVQVRTIREGRECWEDYTSEDNIDDADIELKEYKEIFGEKEVRLIKIIY